MNDASPRGHHDKGGPPETQLHVKVDTRCRVRAALDIPHHVQDCSCSPVVHLRDDRCVRFAMMGEPDKHVRDCHCSVCREDGGSFFYNMGLIVLTLLIGVAAQGFTISVLWGWFVCPIFGLPRLGVLSSFGLAVIFRTILRRDSERDKTMAFSRLVTKTIVSTVIDAVMSLALGGALHWVMSLT